MSLEATYHIEREKWNSLAPPKLTESSVVTPGKNFSTYARRCSTLVGVDEFLGDLRGKRVLDYGCGLGETTTLLAKSGARVSTFDLSAASIVIARQRARLNGVESAIDFTVCAGESLPYPDNTFDVVFGKAILHHLDLKLASPHLHRVLKPGGKAAFSEPMGMNPLLSFAREYIYYPKKNPRGADRPLNYHEIRGWGERFSQLSHQEIQLVSMLERALGFGRRLPTLRRVDEVLLKRFACLRRYCRYVVMLMVK